jgi:glycosyltransferase involved in cell wall biosynthesis
MLAHTIGWPYLDSEFYRTGVVLEGTCVRLADAVYSSSACSADWCAREYGLKREDIPVIHSGVDVTAFIPRPDLKAVQPTIVFAGKLAPNKGIFLLLDACLRLRQEFPDLQLHLLGRGEERTLESLRARARATGHGTLLQLHGFVDSAELPQRLAGAHVFAAPSRYEGGPGFVYLEAMACGLPVIGCEGSGAAEVITHGDTGLLVPPEDLGALTDALRTLLIDASTRERMALAAREYAVTAADTRQCISRLESFYATVAAAAA